MLLLLFLPRNKATITRAGGTVGWLTPSKCKTETSKKATARWKGMWEIKEGLRGWREEGGENTQVEGCPPENGLPSQVSVGYLPNQWITSVGRVAFLFHTNFHKLCKIKVEDE